MLLRILFVGIFLLTSSVAFGGSLKVENPRVRLLPPMQKATGGFMKISNTSDKAIKLLSAASDVSKVVELHTHIKEAGMMKMRKVEYIEVPANGVTMLKPGSYHVMFIDLIKPLKLNQIVNIELVFDNGEKLAVKAPVKKIEVGKAMHGKAEK
jgi:hypothetical protein